MGRRSTIYLAAARDDLLEHIAARKTLTEAAELIGTNVRAVQRYVEGNPEFGEKIRRAKQGTPVNAELPRRIVESVPVEVLPRVTVPAFDRVPTSIGDLGVAELDQLVADYLRDPSNKDWARVVIQVWPYVHGLEMAAIKREIVRAGEWQDGQQPPVLVVRVPVKA